MHLDPLFSPKSIAVIGASTTIGSVGYTLTENLLKNGYAGEVYPVNPKTKLLFDLPCYPSVSRVPYPIDLAIIIVPAHIVPLVLREVGEVGIPSAIIISSGFKETGETGATLENEVATLAKKYNIALLGPNCLGFLRPSLGLNASFAKILPTDGTIAFFSQSGALCTALLDLSGATLGFSHFASIGNKAVIDEDELLRYFAIEKNVSVIGFYSEGLTKSENIIETGRAILARPLPKPVIVLKSGTTASGTTASSSHTGAVAGSDDAYTALFKQARMIRATSLEHLLDLLTVFSHNPLPENNRLAIITNAGGLGVLATDESTQNGLTLAPLNEDTKQKLRAVLPPSASVNNPIDVLGDALALRYQNALEITVADDAVDMILAIVTPQAMTEAKKTAEAIIDIKKKTLKPIVAVFAGKASLADGITLLEQNNVTVFTYPEQASKALSALAQITAWRTRPSSPKILLSDINTKKASMIFAQAKREGRSALTEKEASEALLSYGFPFFASYTVQSKEEAFASAHAIGKKVALKIISPDIIHKSDVGGVMLDIDPKNVEHAYEQLVQNVKNNAPKAKIDGVLVVEMAEKGGKELLLGIKKEPGLGTLLVFGMGGIYVETQKDITMRFIPLNENDIDEMVREIKSYAILTGVRGEHSIDIVYLKELLMRLSQFATDFPEVEELDINPLLTFPNKKDFRVLDARIRITKTSLKKCNDPND